MSKSNSWFEGVKSEWKKIVWPSKKDVQKKSVAVIAVSAVMGTAIAVMDMGFQNIMNLIANLFA